MTTLNSLPPSTRAELLGIARTVGDEAAFKAEVRRLATEWNTPIFDIDSFVESVFAQVRPTAGE